MRWDPGAQGFPASPATNWCASVSPPQLLMEGEHGTELGPISAGPKGLSVAWGSRESGPGVHSPACPRRLHYSKAGL